MSADIIRTPCRGVVAAAHLIQSEGPMPTARTRILEPTAPTQDRRHR